MNVDFYAFVANILKFAVILYSFLFIVKPGILSCNQMVCCGIYMFISMQISSVVEIYAGTEIQNQIGQLCNLTKTRMFSYRYAGF